MQKFGKIIRNNFQKISVELMDVVKDKDFLLCAFQVENWNDDFSPWKAPAAFGNEDFKGEAEKTLQWLTNELIPTIKQRYGTDREIYLIGYFLSGLFSLWAAYETNIFSGVASCSGSLWFEKWDEYIRRHKMQHTCNIYLSLGGKEEKTKNQKGNFCKEISYRQMTTDYTITRMLGYLYRISNPRMEDVVDEMLAIFSDRDAIIQKKELEHAQSVINDVYNRGL